MLAIPKSYKGIPSDASTLYLSVHVEAAISMMGGQRLWTFAETISRRDLIPIGVDHHNARRASQALPNPWTGCVGDHVCLDVTPCTRSAFASITGRPGATTVGRQDLVALCISHERLWGAGASVVYSDRLCTRAGARFSGDRALLEHAAWPRIRRRDFRPDPADPELVHHYDAPVLARGPLPTSLVGAVVCKDLGTADRVRTRLPARQVDVLVLPDLLW